MRRALDSVGTRVCLLIVLWLGCGCSSSGTWENAPGNWGRAFRSGKPDDVLVLHSKYWRSPHWTCEFEYFFEIASNDRLKGQLLAENKLTKLEGKDAEEAKGNFFGESPPWFAPKTTDNYDIWVLEDKTSGHFRVFIDRATGNIFLTDHQV